MTNSAALLSFVEDELTRAPMLAQKVMDDTLAALSNMPMSSDPAERFKALDLTMALRPQRRRVAAAFVDCLGLQVKRLISGERGPQRAAEGQVSSDALIANCIDQITLVAEFEFRELTAFVSALVGDTLVTSDHNPFKPEVIAHALWGAAQSLTEDDGLRAVFMKVASTPLAQELRREFAAACGRLEDAGVLPAMYSSVVDPSGAKLPIKPAGWDSETAAAPFSSTTVSPRIASDTQPAELPADPDYLGLLNRLFDVILADRRLAADVKFAISRLQAPAVQLAHTDDSLLDTHDHALWLLLDRIAWQSEVLPEAPHPARSAVMQTIGSLISQLNSTTTHEPSAYQWTLSNVMTSERQRFDQRRQRLVPVINELESLALKSTQPTELAGTTIQTLGMGQMDTVPSQLLDIPSAPEGRAAGKRWITSLRPGHVARIYLSGNWVNAQLVWVDTQQDLFLWADCRSDAVWPIKRPALALLQAESLAMAHEPRCLVRAAARLVAVQISRNRPA